MFTRTVRPQSLRTYKHQSRDGNIWALQFSHERTETNKGQQRARPRWKERMEGIKFGTHEPPNWFQPFYACVSRENTPKYSRAHSNTLSTAFMKIFVGTNAKIETMRNANTLPRILGINRFSSNKWWAVSCDLIWLKSVVIRWTVDSNGSVSTEKGACSFFQLMQDWIVPKHLKLKGKRLRSE